MPAPKIRSDYDELAAIAKQFGRHASNTSATYRRIRHFKDVLQGGDWRGQGATAFFKEMNSEVLPRLGRLVTALEAAQHYTQRMYLTWREAEEEAARLLQMDGRGGGVGTQTGAGGAVAGEAPDPAANVEAAKAEAKQAAGEAAATWGTRAGGLGVIAGSAGLSTIPLAILGGWPALVMGGIAAGATMLAGAAGLLSAVYSKMANDPPRDDYQMADRFELPQFELKVPESDEEATLQEFSKLAVSQTSAIDSLVTSIERYDGAQAARSKAGETDDEVQGFLKLQAEAAAHNAHASAELGRSQLEMREGVNYVWQQFREQLIEASKTADKPSKREIDEGFAVMQENTQASLREGFKLSDEQLAEVETNLRSVRKSVVPVADLPDQLLDDAWETIALKATAQFQRLSEAYVRLADEL